MNETEASLIVVFLIIVLSVYQHLQVLSLRLGVPVMLLQNLTPDLVNGLRGFVIRMEAAIVYVKFPNMAEVGIKPALFVR